MRKNFQDMCQCLSSCDGCKRMRSRGKTKQGKERQGKARQGKARQGKTRQNKTRQGHTDVPPSKTPPPAPTARGNGSAPCWRDPSPKPGIPPRWFCRERSGATPKNNINTATTDRVVRQTMRDMVWVRCAIWCGSETTITTLRDKTSTGADTPPPPMDVGQAYAHSCIATLGLLPAQIASRRIASRRLESFLLKRVITRGVVFPSFPTG